MAKFNESKSIVALIDILGFKDLVKKNSKSKENLYFYQLQAALSEAYAKSVGLTTYLLSEFDKLGSENIVSRMKYGQFSDTLYFAFDYKEDDESDFEFAVYFVVLVSAYYQRIMLSKNFYVRGGIASGQNFVDEHMIFSDALIKAYEFESKIAKYPRIIIDKQIIKRLPKDNSIKKMFPHILVKDWIGLVFLNPLKVTNSLDKFYKQHPEIKVALENMTTGNPEFIASVHPATLEPEMLDEDIANLVCDNLKTKLKKHRKQPELYEKYVWLREFVNWQDDFYSDLNFRYLR